LWIIERLEFCDCGERSGGRVVSKFGRGEMCVAAHGGTMVVLDIEAGGWCGVLECLTSVVPVRACVVVLVAVI
jgi:hypothetical protein